MSSLPGGEAWVKGEQEAQLKSLWASSHSSWHPMSPCSVRTSRTFLASTPQPRAPCPVPGPGWTSHPHTCLECVCPSPYHQNPPLSHHTVTASICWGGIGSGLHVMSRDIKRGMWAKQSQLNLTPRARPLHLVSQDSTISAITGLPCGRRLDHMDSELPHPETQWCVQGPWVAGAAGKGAHTCLQRSAGRSLQGGEGGGGCVHMAEWAELKAPWSPSPQRQKL